MTSLTHVGEVDSASPLESRGESTFHPSTITYRPEIDGLRAVAVIPVILFHMDMPWIGGGYLGVDVFFVISGFLISLIILKEHDDGRFTFRRFWARRVRRIVPALMAMLLTTSIAAYFLLFSEDLADVGIQGAAAAVSLTNVLMWKTAGNYWGAQANDSPFLHTWSLSVEEHFYLFYPFLLAILLRFTSRRLFGFLSLFVACSFVLYLAGSRYKPEATFYLIPTRAWELGCGCLLAAWVWKGPGRIAQPVSAALAISGLVAVIASFLLFPAKRTFPGYLAIPVLGSVSVIAFGAEGGLVKRLLSHPAAVSVGKISYSLYLWHWPVLFLGRRVTHDSGWMPGMPLLLVLIVLLSVFSYYFIESPGRRASSKSFAIRWSLASFAASLLVSLCLCIAATYHIRMFRLPVWEGRRYSVNPREAWTLGKRTLWVIAPAREDETPNAYATGGIIKRYGDDTPEVVVLGDSHALMWSGTIDRVAEELGRTVSFYAADGISPFMDIPVKKSYPGGNGFTSDQKYIFDVKRLDSLTKWRPKLVVIGARWDVFREDETIALMEFLQHLGSEVILIEQPPILDLGERNPLHYLSDLKLYPEDGRRRYIPASASPAYQSGRALIRSLCRKFPHCHLLETSDLFFADGTSAWALEGAEALYFDDDHLCQYGAEKAKARILDTFQSLFSRDFERVTTD